MVFQRLCLFLVGEAEPHPKHHLAEPGDEAKSHRKKVISIAYRLVICLPYRLY